MPKITNVYLDKKRGTWYAKVSLGFDDRGKRVTKTKRGFSTQKEAKKWHDEFKANNIEMDFLKNNTMLFKNFVNDYYLPDYKGRVRLRTFNQAMGKMKRLEVFYHKKLKDISPILIKKWHNNLLEENLTNNYIRSLHQILQQILDLAVKLGMLENNVAKKIGNIKKSKERVDFWTKEEFEKFIVTFDKSDTLELLKFTSIWFLFLTGVRLGELMALQWSDLDFNNDTVKIEKSMYYKSKREWYITDTKTSASHRLLYIDKVTKKHLEYWMERQKEIGRIEFVFSYDGLPFGTTFLKKVIDTHSEFAGVKRIRVHDLRHSHASFMLSLGMNALEIQNRLGHEDIRTTLGTYSHLKLNAMRDVAERFENKIEVSETDSKLTKFRGNQYIKKHR
ncbi:tyrosine-type recombinase/integrase [Lactococcus lactis]|uniref:site-specific integrase n=1 Tax=Lactococcus lactis TaxID=1358 RepID=UPI0022E33347|nr:tyrosine-type recombinase/integrase [Lactococcus lactis]